MSDHTLAPTAHALPSRVAELSALLDEVIDERPMSDAFWQRYANATGESMWRTDYGLASEPETDDDDEDSPPPPCFAPDEKKEYAEDARPLLLAACEAALDYLRVYEAEVPLYTEDTAGQELGDLLRTALAAARGLSPS